MDDEYRNVRNDEAAQSLVRAAEALLDKRFGSSGELKAEATEIEKRQLGMQQRRLELQAKINARSVYAKRLANYVPLKGTEFCCPSCWLLDERVAVMTERHVGHYQAPDYYVLGCTRCAKQFSFGYS